MIVDLENTRAYFQGLIEQKFKTIKIPFYLP